MSIYQSGDRYDVNESLFIATTVTVTTTPQEVKVGANRNDLRQNIVLYNLGNQTIWYGPSGATVSNGGIPLAKGGPYVLPYGDLAVFVFTQTGTSSLVIHEVG